MNKFYTKTALYAYPNIDAVIEQIDELVERKALCSMSDYSPCEEIAEKIVSFTRQKIALMELKEFMQTVLSKLKKEEIDCIDYKYWRQKPKEYYIDFDFTSRNYFRRQIRIVNKVCERMDKVGATDKWFEQNCLTMDFFKELLKRVYEHEKNSMKNKPKNKVATQNLEQTKTKICANETKKLSA